MNTINIHNKIKSILPTLVEWINVLSILCLIASFILQYKWQIPSISVFTATTILDIIVNKRFIEAKWHKAKWTFVTMILFYSCMWIWHWCGDCSSPIYFHSTDIRLPFLIFGILGLTCKINPRLKITHIAYTMAITSLTTIAILTYKITQHNPTSIDAIQWLLPIIRSELLNSTHIEFNLYLNCTMAISFICILENKKKWSRIILSCTIITIYSTLLITEGRSGFAIANILMLLFVGFIILRYKPKLLIPSIIIFIITIFYAINEHSRLDIEQIKKDPRSTIWDLSINLIKEKPIFGHGVCDGRKKFVELCTTDSRLDYFWDHWMQNHPNYKKNRFHCHNAFLESTIEFGIIGLILCSLLFLLPILLTKNKQQLYLSLFILIFSMQAMFESFTFHIQPILFCWLIMYFINTQLEEKNQI